MQTTKRETPMPRTNNTDTPAPATTAAAIPPPPFVLMTVRQMVQALDGAISEGGIRWDIYNAKFNGLAESGAIIRRGLKGSSILLDRDRYLNWMAGRL